MQMVPLSRCALFVILNLLVILASVQGILPKGFFSSPSPGTCNAPPATIPSPVKPTSYRFFNPFQQPASTSSPSRPLAAATSNTKASDVILTASAPSGSSSALPNANKPKSSFQSTLRQMLPILCSAFTAAAIMYPLDLIRALQMANAGSGLTTSELLANFRKAHGWQGFFTQGLAPELARSTWMRFIKFALFPIIHLQITGKPESQGNEISKALAAIVSSIPEAISIMPLEASKIALQLDTTNQYKNSMFKAMGSIFKQFGWAGFMIGYGGIQYRQAAWSSGYFASIKFFEKQVSKFFDITTLTTKYPKASKTISQLFSGFLAGVFGACLNTPGDTIRSTLQKRAFQGQTGLTFFGIGNEIIQARGWTALYAGFKFKAFHLGGGGALMAFLIPFFNSVFAEKKPVLVAANNVPAYKGVVAPPMVTPLVPASSSPAGSGGEEGETFAATTEKR